MLKLLMITMDAKTGASMNIMRGFKESLTTEEDE